jgi:hypothetical protein
VADLIVFFFAGYYLFKFMKREKQLEEKEKELEKKEGKIDTDYHQVVDNALNKERKILEDAVSEADAIITKTQYVTQNSKEMVNKALQEIVVDVKKEAINVARNFINDYQNSIKQIAAQSLNNFQSVTHELELNLQKQIKDFHETLFPKLEKEVEAYKQERLKEVDRTANIIIQKVSQKVLNKSIPLEDHNNLIIESLEKAKKEGVFD